MDRRRFLSASVGTLASLGLAGVGCGRLPTLPVPRVRPRLRRPSPRPAQGSFSAGDDAHFDLGDGLRSPAWGYDGETPGPLIRVTRGEVLDVVLRNQLSQDTTLHWHGLLPPSSMDGHPADSVRPGQTFRYQFPIRQRAGLAWYHPHPHRAVSEQVYRGMAGALVVTDEEEASLGLPSDSLEHVILLGDGELGPGGRTLRYRAGPSSDRGAFPLVNGAAYPRVEVAATLHRLRLVNGARARVYELEVSPALPFVLIGNDGGLLPDAATLDRVVLGPGERVDLLLDLSRVPSGSAVDLGCRRARWSLLEFRVHESRTDRWSAAAAHPSLPPISRLAGTPIRRERVFEFQGHQRINGVRYRMDRIDFQVPFGVTERWIFRSSGGAPHPVHVHGAHFQVEQRRGGRGVVFPWERGWKDTVLLERREEVSVLIRFDQHPGRFLLHCHRLEHEDDGMMLNFEVMG